MDKLLDNQYHLIKLQPFVERLEKDFYNGIESLCVAARQQAGRLNELELHKTNSQYSKLCIKIIDEIKGYITQRKEGLLPYLTKLYAQEEVNHNCLNCTGNCSLQHELQIENIKESHIKIRETLYKLQMAALPLYSESIYPDVYRILRNQMALLENSLSQLAFLEENYLIPKIVEVQNNIHAISR